MKKGLFDRRIPTVVALFVLLFIVGVSTILVKSGIFYIGRAAPDTTPQNYSVSNVTDSSFTVVFTTKDLVEAAVALTNGNTGNTISLDDRDKKTGQKNKYYSHHITVLGLKALTDYSFTILSGNDQYNDASYKVKTGSTINKTPPSQNPIYGKVLNPDGSAGVDSLVIAKTDGASLFTAYTNQNGEFIMPTNSLRNTTLDDYFLLSENTKFEITVIKQNMKASVNSTFKISQNLPSITLLQQYSFTPDNISSSPSTPSDFAANIKETKDSALTITVPKSGESFTDLRPQFEGTALPQSSVNLSVDGMFSQDVLANDAGQWTFRTDKEFPPGKFTLNATSKDENGNQISASSNFSIFPQGSQVFAESLGPTTTLTPTPHPTSLPTPTFTPTPTLAPIPTAVTPTAESTQTPSVIPTQTPTPLPTIPVTPTKVPPLPSPGSLENTYLLAGLSVLMIAAGGIILFVL